MVAPLIRNSFQSNTIRDLVVDVGCAQFTWKDEAGYIYIFYRDEEILGKV